MCGRFTLTVSIDKLVEAFPHYDLPAVRPRYNVAPSQAVLAVRQEEAGSQPKGVFLRWGLIPSWAKDLAIGNRNINARSESVADKPTFRAAFKRRRCLILADGFYEWQKLGGTGKNARKQPYHIHLRDMAPFAFAGLWEYWKGAEDEPPVESCTILTTEANDLVRPLHDRMPVILPPELRDRWLDPAPQDPGIWLEMLRPYPADGMEAIPVGTLVNNPRHDESACLEPISLAAAEQTGEKPPATETSPSLFDAE